MKPEIKAILLGMFVLFGLAGCNTMHGAGEDIEEGGEAIQRSTY